MTSAEVPRAKAREHVASVIDDYANVYLMLEFRQKAHRKEAWSTSGAAGLQNAQAIVGGPAGPPPS